MDSFPLRSLAMASMCIAIFAIGSTPYGLSAAAARSDEIQRIENGLLPAAFVKGTPVQPMRLTDRMFVYHVTGVSVAVIHNSEVAWSSGFGNTRLGGSEVTSDTVFQAASISKPVTAFAALLLVQSGKLALDVDVNRYLKSWRVPENRFTRQRKVTLRELLTHTAGTTVPGFPGYRSTDPFPTLVQVLNGESPANTPPIQVDIVPGTKWRYSGGGYAIVQQLLIDITGKGFPKLMEDMVLVPLGMTHSTFSQPLSSAFASNHAAGYRSNGEQLPGGAHIFPEMAAAGLWTTAGDLARFLIAVQDSITGRPGAMLSRPLAELFVATQLGRRGVIFGVRGSTENAYFAHSGQNFGFSAYMLAFEKNREGAVVMTNSDGGFNLAEEVMRAVAQEYRWPELHPVEHVVVKVAPRALDEYAGRYEISSGVFLCITRTGDHIFAEIAGQTRWEMLPDSPKHFFSQAANVQIGFEPDRTGHITRAVVRQYGDEFIATKIR